MRTTKDNTRRSKPAPRRRGGGIVAIIILLAAVNLAVIGAISASGDEAQIGAMRAETARAFYVAESGARVLIKTSTAGLTMPAPGSTLTLGNASCTYVSFPAAGQAGDAIVQGVDGTAARRLKFTLSGF
jgi:Tfp pilus assembly protein PilX